MLPILYIKDSKGKTRQWSVKTDGAKVIVSHGVKGGKLIEKVTTSKPMNVGRANATTAEEQAILEAQSKWTHQVQREDYHEDVELSGLQLRPMLALDYLKVPHRVKWDDAVAQPKLDGLRLVVGNRYTDGRDSPFEMMTRKGETYDVPHMIGPCVELLRIVNSYCGGRCIALDGEAYVHGMPLQTITSLARKYQPGHTEYLEYHLFDLVIKDMCFADRYLLLTNALTEYYEEGRGEDLFRLVPTEDISPETLGSVQARYMQEGFEGLMVRHCGSPYAIASRSPDLFKYKLFYDDEFKIIDIWEDKDGNAMFTCETAVGKALACNGRVVSTRKEFHCTPKRSHSLRKEMLQSPWEYIGKWLTVKYQDLTIDEIPTFPVGLDVRECDDEGNPAI